MARFSLRVFENRDESGTTDFTWKVLKGSQRNGYIAFERSTQSPARDNEKDFATAQAAAEARADRLIAAGDHGTGGGASS